MGLPAINSLAYMELMLYGGKAGLNSACPSFLNGYRGNVGMYNNMMGIYNNPYISPNNFGFNPTFQGGSIYDSFTPSYGQQQQASNNVGFGASEADLNILGDYYLKGLSPSESLINAAAGGVVFGAINNPRVIVHPWNSLKATLSTNKIFEEVTKEGSNLNALWKNAETTNIMQEAYARTHKLEALNNSKLGLFRKRIDSAEYDRLKKVMEDALKFSGTEAEKIKKIAEATEEIKKATNAYTGAIPRGLRALGLQKPFTALRKHINPSQYEAITKVAAENVAKEGTELTLGKSMAKSCGFKNGLLFAAFEFLNDMVFEKKIQKAFSKDSSTGWTQVGQTTVKGISSAVGWAVGEGIGAWAGGLAAAKVGAMAGTAIAPGVGTVIGAVAGLVGGSIGMWLTGKITKKIIGQDVADKVEVENMKKTPEGQAQLLQLTVQQAQSDKKIDARTLQALQNVARVYGLT